MKGTIWAVAAIGMALLIAALAPDIRRYVRMVTM